MTQGKKEASLLKLTSSYSLFCCLQFLDSTANLNIIVCFLIALSGKELQYLSIRIRLTVARIKHCTRFLSVPNVSHTFS